MSSFKNTAKCGKKKSINNRFRKGASLKNKVIIVNNSNFNFTVPSESDKSVNYSVTFKDKKLSCNCGIKYIGEERNQCKHIAAILLKLIMDYDNSINVNDVNKMFKMFNV